MQQTTCRQAHACPASTCFRRMDRAWGNESFEKLAEKADRARRRGLDLDALGCEDGPPMGLSLLDAAVRRSRSPQDPPA